MELNLLTLQEAMDLFKISRSTINRWRRDKGFPCIKIGRDVYVDQDQLTKWVTKHVQHVNNHDTENIPQIDNTITIGYHSGNAHLWSSFVIKELKLFEEELQKLHLTRRVNWINLNAPRQMEELVAGRIHIASLADLPIVNLLKISIIFPLFQAILLAFDGKSPRSQGISLAIPRGYDSKNIQNISKCEIEVLPNSGSWHRLNKFLFHHKITDVTITPQYEQENIMFEQSKLRAVCEPYSSLIQYYQLGKVIDFKECEDDYLTGIVAESQWVSKNEDIVTAYLKSHLRAHQIMRNDPLYIAKIISKQSGFPSEVIFRLLTNINWEAAINIKDLETLQNIALFNGLSFQEPKNTLDSIHLQRNYINNHYLETAAKQLNK